MLTELDIARSLLANQRHQELAAMEAQQQQQPAGGMGQQLMAFPVQLGSMHFNPRVRAAVAADRQHGAAECISLLVH